MKISGILKSRYIQWKANRQLRKSLPLLLDLLSDKEMIKKAGYKVNVANLCKMIKQVGVAAVLVLFLTGCAAHVTPGPKPGPIVDHTITVTWNQSFVNNNACSATIKTSCISGFNVGYIVGSAQTQLHNDPASVCTGSAQPLACTTTFNGLVPIGNVTFYVATTFIDQNGAAGVTTAANSPGVPVAADAATNVNAVIVQ